MQLPKSIQKRPVLAMLAIAAISLVLVAAPAVAYVLPVIDPEAIAHLVTTNSKLAQQIAQYATMISQYAHIIATTDAQLKTWNHTLTALGSRQAWETAALKQLHSNVGNTYGETAQINSILNGQPLFTLDDVWKKATVAMNGTSYMSGDTVGASTHLANTAGIELTDGFSVDALTAISTYRQNEQQNVAAITSLQQKTESTDDDDNTLIAQQNLTNAALMRSIVQQLSGNSLNSVILEQLTAQNTWQRNMAVELSNLYAGSTQAVAANPSAYVNGGSTLARYTLP